MLQEVQAHKVPQELKEPVVLVLQVRQVRFRVLPVLRVLVVLEQQAHKVPVVAQVLKVPQVFKEPVVLVLQVALVQQVPQV